MVPADMYFGRRVDDLVDGLHCKVKGHEFNDWPQSSHSSTTADTSKPSLGNCSGGSAKQAKIGPIKMCAVACACCLAAATCADKAALHTGKGLQSGKGCSPL